VELDNLEPHPLSFIRILPQALNHVFLRPIPGEQPGALSLFSGVETYFVLLILILSFLVPARDNIPIPDSAPLLAILFFAFSNYLFIGYTIPFLGAIVRYRIIFESLLLTVAATRINWQKLVTKNLYEKLQ
jgi:hypothetical protein